MDLVKKVLVLSALGAGALAAAACAATEPAQPVQTVQLEEACVAQDVREEGRVASRAYTPGDDGMAEGLLYGVALDNLPLGLAMSPALATPESYLTVIETESGRSIASERESVYNAFEEGDSVAVEYVLYGHWYDRCYLDLDLVGVELLPQ